MKILPYTSNQTTRLVCSLRNGCPGTISARMISLSVLKLISWPKERRLNWSFGGDRLAGGLRPYLVHPKTKNFFQNPPLHQILEYMHKALDIDKNKN
jgi:hypothetical protein